MLTEYTVQVLTGCPYFLSLAVLSFHARLSRMQNFKLSGNLVG